MKEVIVVNNRVTDKRTFLRLSAEFGRKLSEGLRISSGWIEGGYESERSVITPEFYAVDPCGFVIVDCLTAHLRRIVARHDQTCLSSSFPIMNSDHLRISRDLQHGWSVDTLLFSVFGTSPYAGMLRVSVC